MHIPLLLGEPQVPKVCSPFSVHFVPKTNCYFGVVMGALDSPVARLVVREGAYTEQVKSPPLPVRLGWDQGKTGACTIEVKMVAGGGAGPKQPVNLAWGRKGWVGRWTHTKHGTIWEAD